MLPFILRSGFFLLGHGSADFVPAHVARACDRLLRGMDGISISLFFACVVRHLPRYSGCLTCGYNWRNGCRGHLSFCAMCGSSDDED